MEIIGRIYIKVFLRSVPSEQIIYITKGRDISSIKFILGIPFVRSCQVSFNYRNRGSNLLIRAVIGSTHIITAVAGGVYYRNPDTPKVITTPYTNKQLSIYPILIDKAQTQGAEDPEDLFVCISNQIIQNHINNTSITIIAALCTEE